MAVDRDAPDAGYLVSTSQVRLADMAGDVAMALQAAQRSAEYSEACGDPPAFQISVNSALALAQLLAGRWNEAIDAAHASIRIREDRGLESWEGPVAWVYLSEALLGAKDWEAALDAATTACEQARERNFQYVELRALRSLALSRAHLEAPDADGIDSLLDAADVLIERTHTHAMTPRIVEARAELAALRGDPDRQRAYLGEAHRLYTEMGATGHAERLAKELGL